MTCSDLFDVKMASFLLLQEEIHELLLSFAEVGANVVRLKGGDPLVGFYLFIIKSSSFLFDLRNFA